MSTNEKHSVSSEATSITSEDIVTNNDQFGPTLNRNSEGDNASGERTQDADADFADPQTDVDPRTSNTGFTSVGSTDLNADESQDAQQSADDVPGVRRGEGEASYE